MTSVAHNQHTDEEAPQPRRIGLGSAPRDLTGVVRHYVFVHGHDTQQVVHGIHRLLGTRGEQRFRVVYPMWFVALALIAFSLGFIWLFNFFVIVPAASEPVDSRCNHNANRLRRSAVMLFVYFICLTSVRMSIFVPSVAVRVGEGLSGARGCCHKYIVHMVLYGPGYIFGIASLLFWIQLLQGDALECEQSNVQFYRSFKLYAGYSFLVSFVALLLACWHSRLISAAYRRHEQEVRDKRCAPPGTLENLPVCPYDPRIFGDEEGRPYPAECPVCLLPFEPEEVIKITPCRHAFHEECLGMWLQTARTCAMCRQDVTKKPPEVVPLAMADPVVPSEPNMEWGASVFEVERAI